MITKASADHFTQPLATATETPRHRFTIGLPAVNSTAEQRFPLTPEGVKMLTQQGYRIKIESAAAAPIHYTDAAYSRCGADITSRADTLKADIVIHLGVPSASDILAMRRGAMLLTMLNLPALTPQLVDVMLHRGIVSVAIDLVGDDNGNLPFADILSEIDGRAAIACASSLLADSVTGKGILLGGVAGIVPCEITIIGSGIAAIAAARSASGLGAIVRMFDNDAYSLRAAVRDLGPGIIASALHDKVLLSALHSADIIIVTPGAHADTHFDANTIDELKKGVLTFDLTPRPGHFFPSMPTINLADSRSITTPRQRICYVNAGNAVPRTVAMALSNTFITMFHSIIDCEGLTNALKLTPGLRRGVLTFFGKITNPDVARIARSHSTDINIFLQLY